MILLTFLCARAEAMIRQMPFKLPGFSSTVAADFKDHADLLAENIALRHQLSCVIHRGRRPKLRPVDRVVRQNSA